MKHIHFLCMAKKLLLVILVVSFTFIYSPAAVAYQDTQPNDAHQTLMAEHSPHSDFVLAKTQTEPAKDEAALQQTTQIISSDGGQIHEGVQINEDEFADHTAGKFVDGKIVKMTPK